MEESAEVQNDIEVVKKMEDEHLRLMRQFRGIQTDRAHRTMGVHPQFRSQDQLLKILKKEFMSLNKDLKIARSGRHKKNDKKMKINLEKSLMQMTEFEMDCEGGYNIMDELDGLLQLKAKEMIRLKKLTIASEGELEERRFRSEKNLQSAENKLETAMLRFNSVQCENKRIRDEIEHMLKDRALFNQAWNKMLTALGKGKKFLSDLFESSTLAYDQRDEWCNKLSSIQEKGKMDQVLQVQEMRDLKKAYDHETKIYNFLAKKGVKRINKTEEKREAEDKKKRESEAEKNCKEHQDLLDEIGEYCGEYNYIEIKKRFKLIESQNFSTYKLLTEYCAENEILGRDVNRIRRDVADRRDFNEQKTLHHEENLVQLGRELEEQKTRSDKLRAKVEDKTQMMNRIMGKINEIFTMLECSLEPFQKSLGDKHPSLHTVRLALILITQRIQEYVEIVYFTERHAKKLTGTQGAPTSRLKKYTIRSDTPVIFTPMPLNLLVPADPCPSCIESRWLSRVSELPEAPFEGKDVALALKSLSADPAYIRSDRVHALADCRATASRRLLATRHHHF